MNIQEIVVSQDLQNIQKYFNETDPKIIFEQMEQLKRKHQRILFEKADPNIEISDVLPDQIEPCQEVILSGMNTLPLPKDLKRFEKRVCVPKDRKDVLFGYNEGVTRKMIGPGYFVLKSTKGNPKWEQRGGLVVDYFEVPDSDVVAGWPEIKKNSQGLQFFVYNNTRDFLRKITDRVSIGVAYKKEKCLDHYFLLLRL
jgi:hypothetical protein